MIAASLKDSEGDPIIDLLLRKDADVNMKSNSGQVSLRLCFNFEVFAGRSRINLLPNGIECHPLRGIQKQPIDHSQTPIREMQC